MPSALLAHGKDDPQSKDAVDEAGIVPDKDGAQSNCMDKFFDSLTIGV